VYRTGELVLKKLSLIILIMFILLTGCKSQTVVQEQIHDTAKPEDTAVSPVSTLNPKVTNTSIMVDLTTWDHPLNKLFKKWQYSDTLVSVELTKNKTYPIFTFTAGVVDKASFKVPLDSQMDYSLYFITNQIGKSNGWWDFELRTDKHDWQVYFNKTKKELIKAFDAANNTWTDFNELPCPHVNYPTKNNEIVDYIKSNFLTSLQDKSSVHLLTQKLDYKCQPYIYLTAELNGTGIIDYLEYNSINGEVTNNDSKQKFYTIMDDNNEDVLKDAVLLKQYQTAYSLIAGNMRRKPDSTEYYYCQTDSCTVPVADADFFGLHITNVKANHYFLIRLTRITDTANTFFYVKFKPDGSAVMTDDYGSVLN
jgi:hypothetical protein